jgi:hypothetical protein
MKPSTIPIGLTNQFHCPPFTFIYILDIAQMFDSILPQRTLVRIHIDRGMEKTLEVITQHVPYTIINHILPWDVVKSHMIVQNIIDIV